MVFLKGLFGVERGGESFFPFSQETMFDVRPENEVELEAYTDSESCLAVAGNLGLSRRIRQPGHEIYTRPANRQITVGWVPGGECCSDLLTKILSKLLRFIEPATGRALAA